MTDVCHSDDGESWTYGCTDGTGLRVTNTWYNSVCYGSPDSTEIEDCWTCDGEETGDDGGDSDCAAMYLDGMMYNPLTRSSCHCPLSNCQCQYTMGRGPVFPVCPLYSRTISQSPTCLSINTQSGSLYDA